MKMQSSDWARWLGAPVAFAVGMLIVGCGDDGGGGGSGQGGSGAGGQGASGTGAGQTGGNGSGGSASCGGKQTFCTDRCVDTALNPLHCGACGAPCAADEVCIAGACEVASCDGAGGDACAGLGCCAGVCCPEGTTCFSDIPSFYGCCPEGDNCGCISANCPDG